MLYMYISLQHQVATTLIIDCFDFLFVFKLYKSQQLLNQYLLSKFFKSLRSISRLIMNDYSLYVTINNCPAQESSIITSSILTFLHGKD